MEDRCEKGQGPFPRNCRAIDDDDDDNDTTIQVAQAVMQLATDWVDWVQPGVK